MEYKDLKELALHSVRGTAPANYDLATVDRAFVAELNNFFPNGKDRRINDFEKNKYDIFALYMDVADEILPKRVIEQMGAFANVQFIPQGNRPIFKRKLGRQRAKLFLTQAAVSGVYETFRLDTETYTINMSAHGIATRLDFERLLDGAESLAEHMAVMNEAFVEHTFIEVQRALVRAATDLKNTSVDTNVISDSSFNAANLQKLMNVARAYGPSIAIFATPEFISEMGPDAIVPGGSGYVGVYSPDDIDAIHKKGIVQIFRGAPLIPLQQSFVDEKNKQTWINPQYAYILPVGQEKVVDVAFEGGLQVNGQANTDNSIEIHAYQKMGVAIKSYHNWCIYQNKGITNTSIG